MTAIAKKTAKRNPNAKPATNKAKATTSPKGKATNKPTPPPAPTRTETLVVKQNGQTQPKAGTTCAQVWGLCDVHNGERKAVLAAGLAANINPHTVKTQLARWRTFNGIMGRAPKAQALATAA